MNMDHNCPAPLHTVYLTAKVQEQSAQIQTLTEHLTALQKLHKALEGKFNRVMKFVESMHLKERLEAFLQREHKRTR